MPLTVAKIIYNRITLRWNTGQFQNGCHENAMFVIQFQKIDYMLTYCIKCTRCGFTKVFRQLSDNRGFHLEK